MRKDQPDKPRGHAAAKALPFELPFEMDDLVKAIRDSAKSAVTAGAAQSGSNAEKLVMPGRPLSRPEVPASVQARIERQDAIGRMAAPPAQDAGRDDADATRLIKSLFGDDDLLSATELREIYDSGSDTFRTISACHTGTARELVQILPKVRRRNDVPGTNVLVGVNPRIPDKTGKESVDRAVALHADVDGAIPPEVAFMAEKCFLDPTISFSGGGCHLYLRLSPPLKLSGDPAAIGRIERLNRRFASLFGGGDRQACTVERHLLRLPGFVNWPDEGKRAKGRSPTRSYLHCLSAATYTIEELDEILPEDEASGGMPAGPGAMADDAELRADDFRGWTRLERMSRYRAYLMSDAYPESVEGQKGDLRLFKAVVVRFGFAVCAEDAATVLREYNEAKCRPRWDEKTIATKLRGQRYKGAVGDKLGDKAQPAVPVEPAAAEPRRPEFVRPASAEVGRALAGSPIVGYGKEVSKISDEIAKDHVLLDAILVAGLVLANRGVRIGLDEDDYAPIWTNVYAMKISGSGCGKGRTSRLVVALAPRFGIPLLRGESESAIIGVAKAINAGMGLYYKSEIKKIMDPSDVTARQIVNTFLGAFDEGRMTYTTRPRGELTEICVEPARPSMLVDGQASTIEESLGKSLINAGFLARFMVSMPPEPRRKRLVEKGRPDLARIEDAYRPYLDAQPRVVIRPIYSVRCRGTDYERHMTDDEVSAWSRLANEYVPKIALMLDPGALQTGRISTEALDRAAVVADWFFPGSMRLLGLMHDDKAELRRVRAVRYIANHQGPKACTDRNLYQHLRCSVAELTRDVAPTIIARGDAHRDKDGYWHPGPDPNERKTKAK